MIVDEQRLRDALNRLAAQADGPMTGTGEVGRRSYRRIARNELITAVVVLVVAVMGVVAVRELPERQTAPVAPSPTPTDEREALPPMEGRIAFITSRGQGPAEQIFVMGADGSDLQPLTTTPNHFYSRVSWSPDGNRVVVGRGLGKGLGSLVVVDIRTGEESVVFSDEGATDALNPQEPAWSPDGNTIAFSSGRGDIYVINVDGTELTRIVSTTPECGDDYPAWSPDATEIAFRRDCPGGIFAVSVTDGSLRRLTDDRRDSQPAWSPDGGSIAFSRAEEGGRNIFVLDVTSGELSRLTEEVSNYSPAWSSDGTGIVFGSNRTGAQHIWAMRSDGSRQQPLTRGGFVDIAPAWSPP
jgi:TolB protein